MKGTESKSKVRQGLQAVRPAEGKGGVSLPLPSGGGGERKSLLKCYED